MGEEGEEDGGGGGGVEGSIDGIVWSLFKRLSGGEGGCRPDRRDTVSAVNY